MKDAEEEANRLLARRFYEEIIGRARFGQLDEILGADIVWHDPLLPKEDVHGIEAFRQVLMLFRSAFPSLQIKLEDKFCT